MSAAAVGPGPTLGLLYAATFWGFVWYPSRLLEQAGLAGTWLTLSAYLAAFLFFLPFARHSLEGFARHRAEILALIIAAGWTNTAFVLAVLEGEVVRVVLLFYLSPLWTALLGRWLLSEALTRQTAVMLALGLSGAVVMMWEPSLGRVPLNTSDVLAVSAGMAFAMNNVMTRRITGLGVRAKAHVAFLGVVLVSLAFIGIGQVPMPRIEPAVWGGAVLLGLLGFLLSTVAVTYGVSRMPVQRSAVIMLFELIVGAFSAWWLAGEGVSLRDWIGGGLILAAAMVAILQSEGSR
jgi:drug/metabolite transporter (DMT)-like permease